MCNLAHLPLPDDIPLENDEVLSTPALTTTPQAELERALQVRSTVIQRMTNRL